MKKNRNMCDDNNRVFAWTQLYTIILFLVFPLYYQNSYINILEAKTEFFIIISMIYLVGCTALVLPPIFLNKRKKEKQELFIKDNKNIDWVDVFGIILLFSVIVSTILADNIWDTLWGTNDRLFGTVVLLLCIGVYYCFSRYYKWNASFFWCCLIGTGMVSILAIMNRFEIDILGMYKAIDVSQKPEYLSTIGQINILSAYLCGFLLLFSGLYMYSSKKTSEIAYGGVTILIFFAGICSNSDSFFLAIGVMGIFYITIALIDVKKLSKIFLLFAFFSATMLFAKWISNYNGEVIWRELQNKWIEQLPWEVFLIIFIFLSFIFNKKIKLKSEKLKKLREIWIALLVSALLIIVIYVIMINITFAGSEKAIANNWLFFSDEWGTNRGYVWQRTMQLFCKLPLKNKIFGIGPGGFSQFFSEYYIDSISKFGYYFESAHNQFLEFLVTTGIAGTIGYVGMIVFSIVSCLRKKTDICLVLASFFLIWMMQAMVNDPLIFTMPYVFAIMGMAKAS